MNQFAGDIETRWFAQTTENPRIIHFRTRIGNDYARTGIGSMQGLSSNFTSLTGHSAFIPGTSNLYFSDKGDYAFTNFPFYEGAARHWGIRGEAKDNIGGSGANGNRWEVDNFLNDFSRITIHRVWVRAVSSSVVTNTLDRGGGSLRDAILWANASLAADTITFAIAGAGPHTITLASALPTLTDNGTVIDGTTQPGTQCRDLWLGSGHDLRINLRGGGFNGLQLNGANQTIRGLSLTSFDNAIITLAGSSTATIQCNYLGLLANGTNGNNSRGVLVRGASVRIGGLAAGEGNVIAHGGQNGITISTIQPGFLVAGNTIRNNTGHGILMISPARAGIIMNRIFGNGLLGIDLNGDGVTPNDAGDADEGPNALINFPVLQNINVLGPSEIGYNFTLDTVARTNGYRIEFFANTAADPSGFGEGQRYLGFIDITHAGGQQSHAGTLTTLEPVSIGDIISATTTRQTNGAGWDITSEFSAVATADGVAQIAATMTSEVFDPPADNPFATPGNDMLLTTTVTNNGTGSTDADSVVAVIAISPDASFYNAVTPALGGIVGFASGASSLTFNPATDLRFSNAASAPQSLAQCTYTPATGYDPQVRYVCLNPKETLLSGTPQGQLTIRLRARIN